MGREEDKDTSMKSKSHYLKFLRNGSGADQLDVVVRAIGDGGTTHNLCQVEVHRRKSRW